MMFGCVSRECANAQNWKKKKKDRLTGSKTHKTTNLHRPHVSCVCVASVGMREGGVREGGIKRVCIDTLQWRGCFDFWV